MTKLPHSNVIPLHRRCPACFGPVSAAGVCIERPWHTCIGVSNAVSPPVPVARRVVDLVRRFIVRWWWIGGIALVVDAALIAILVLSSPH